MTRYVLCTQSVYIQHNDSPTGKSSDISQMSDESHGPPVYFISHFARLTHTSQTLRKWLGLYMSNWKKKTFTNIYTCMMVIRFLNEWGTFHLPLYFTGDFPIGSTVWVGMRWDRSRFSEWTNTYTKLLSFPPVNHSQAKVLNTHVCTLCLVFPELFDLHFRFKQKMRVIATLQFR